MTTLSKDEIVKMAREAGLWVTGFPTEHIEHFATLCRAPLVAENEGLKESLESVLSQLKERDAELEQTRVQLAGCGVAAMQNTEGSKAHRIERGAYGWSESYGDVCRMVDSEIELRAEYLAAHITYDKGYQKGRLDAESLNIPVAEVGVSIFTWLGDRPPAGTTLYRIDQL